MIITPPTSSPGSSFADPICDRCQRPVPPEQLADLILAGEVTREDIGRGVVKDCGACPTCDHPKCDEVARHLCPNGEGTRETGGHARVCAAHWDAAYNQCQKCSDGPTDAEMRAAGLQSY